MQASCLVNNPNLRLLAKDISGVNTLAKCLFTEISSLCMLRIQSLLCKLILNFM